MGLFSKKAKPSAEQASSDGVNLRIEPGRDPVDQLIDDIIILATECQTAFAERYADMPGWRVDLDKPAVFWFTTEPPVMFRPHFLGTTSKQSNTWLWGWENINKLSKDVIDVADDVLSIGKAIHAVELTTAQLPLDATARQQAGLPARDDPETTLIYAAEALSGLRYPVYYRAPMHETSNAHFLLDNDDAFTLPAPTSLATSNAIVAALSSGHMIDHMRAVRSYAARRGVQLTEQDDTTLLQVTDGTLTMRFDDQGRLAGLSGFVG